MMEKTLRAEERLEIMTNLLTDEQLDEYARICAGIESQQELCGLHDTLSECEICEAVGAPVPRPTEVKHDRVKCGQRKTRTVEEINHDIEFQSRMNREGLSPIIE